MKKQKQIRENQKNEYVDMKPRITKLNIKNKSTKYIIDLKKYIRSAFFEDVVSSTKEIYEQSTIY